MTKRLPFFVYGTLRTGGVLHEPYFGNSVISSSPAWMSGAQMTVSPGPSSPGIPYVYHVEDQTKTVRGDLIIVDPFNFESILFDLDSLEGYNEASPTYNHYWRREVVVDGIDGQVKAWCYLAQRSTAHAPGNHLIDGGNYLRYVSKFYEEMFAPFKVPVVNS